MIKENKGVKAIERRAAIPVAAVLVFFFAYMLLLPRGEAVNSSLNTSNLKQIDGLKAVRVTSAQAAILSGKTAVSSYQNMTGASQTSSPQSAATPTGSAIANNGLATPEENSTDSNYSDPISLMNALDSSNISVTSSANSSSLKL